MTLLYRLKDKLLLMLALAVVVYLGMVWYADGERLLEAFEHFPPIALAQVLGLICVGYFFRFLKWEYCLRRLGFVIPLGLSIRIFVSGIAMTITPGKVGEVLKSYLLKESQGIPMAQSSPVVFAERLADLFAVMLLALSGFLLFEMDPRQALIGIVAFIVLIGLASFRPLALGVIKVFERMPVVGKHAHKLHEFYESSYRLLLPLPLSVNTLLSVLGWGCECVAVFVTTQGLGIAGISVAKAFFIFSFGTLSGVITPGGLGVTDGVMLTLFTAHGATPALASAATLIVRACTLWFGVVVGCLMLLVGKVDAKALDTVEDAP